MKITFDCALTATAFAFRIGYCLKETGKRYAVNKISAAGVAIAGMISSQALAADLPARPAPIPAAPALAPAITWSGFYVGGNVGYSWGRSDVAIDETFTLPDGLLPVSGGHLKPKGIIGGLQAGYNWQFHRNGVLGLETDFQWSGQKDSASNSTDVSRPCGQTGCFNFVGYDGTLTRTFDSKITWLGTVRGRVGFAADGIPNILFYGTGGLAYGSVETSSSASLSGLYFNNFIDCGVSGCSFTSNAGFSETKTRIGWTLGGG